MHGSRRGVAAFAPFVGPAVMAGLLYWDRHGFRRTEWIIAVMIGIVCLAYVVQLFFLKPDWRALGNGLVSPNLPDKQALLLAAGIVGATVMPHALYLHAGLSGFRLGWLPKVDRGRLLRYSRWEILAALGLAGLVNLAMTVTAAGTFHRAHATSAAWSRRIARSFPCSVARRQDGSCCRWWHPACRVRWWERWRTR